MGRLGSQGIRTAAVVVVGVLALATLGAMVAVTASRGWRAGGDWVHQAPPQTRTAAVADGQTLTLHLRDGGGVTVVDGPAGQASVTATLRWAGSGRGGTQLVWAQDQGLDGPEVTVGASPRTWSWFGMSPNVLVQLALPPGVSLRLSEDDGPVTLGGTHPSATLAVTNGRVEVNGFHGVLNAADGNGQVAVADSMIQGDLTLATVNGRVEVNNTQVDGALQAHTTNGALDLQGVRLSGAFNLHSENGRISYAGSGGTGGQAVTVNGAVAFRLDTPATPGHYTVSTRQGQVDWPSAAGPQFGNITLGTTNGRVNWLGGGSGA